MNGYFRGLPLALAILAPLPALATGQVIFSSGDVSLVGADGNGRAARKGDAIRLGERVLTGPDGMAQIKMPDGSFIGVRPASEVTLQDFRATGADAGSVLRLDSGTVRVLNLKTTDAERPLAVQLQSPDGARLLVHAGDLESGRSGGLAADAKLFARLNAGEALARTTQGDIALTRHSVSGVTRTGIESAAVSALPPIAIQRAAAPPLNGQLTMGPTGSMPSPGTAANASSALAAGATGSLAVAGSNPSGVARASRLTASASAQGKPSFGKVVR